MTKKNNTNKDNLNLTKAKIKELKSKTKWTKAKALKELNKSIIFLSNLSEIYDFEKNLPSENDIKFEMKTLISSMYLMDRQFEFLQPGLDKDDMLWFDFREIYDEEKIKDAVVKNFCSQDLTRTNIFGLYVDNDGLPVADATCPGYFKKWEKGYYSDFNHALNFLMEQVAFHYLDGQKVFSAANKEITK